MIWVFNENDVYIDEQGFLTLAQRESNEEETPSVAEGEDTL